MRPIFPFASALLLASIAGSNGLWAEPVNPAHELAQKFADDGRKAPPPSKPAVQPAASQAINPDANYEAEMLAAARAEADARRVAETSTTPPTQPAPAKPATEPKPAAAEPPAAAPPPVKEAATKPPAPAAPDSTHALTNANDTPAQVTVLLVLTANPTSESRSQSQPNPLICFSDACYASSGASKAARMMPREETLNLKNSAAEIPGACQGRTHCIFRNITLKPGASLQVVDAGSARSKPSEPVDARADTSCDVDEGELGCDNPLASTTYRAWLIPEDIAENATIARLEAALQTDLIEEDVTRAEDK